ncbi:hypothetical protein DRP04_06365 [Archaeoglobales archaeon]|nr:MAG: hypothetical protein DRP04_06365 [Archaeoglobales archaeon]
MLKFLEKAEDKADVAKTSAKLLDVATHFLIVPAKKRIYVWCKDQDVEKVKKIISEREVIAVKKLRGSMSLVVGTY